MRVMWGYVWGIWWWRNTGKSMDPSRIRTQLCTIPTILEGAGDLSDPSMQDLRDRGLASGIPLGIPCDIVIASRRVNARSRRFDVHQWNGFVPAGSICSASGDTFVASPEFCLLQVASQLGRLVSTTLRPWQLTVILTELVCELCGTYSKQNTARGFKDRTLPLTTIGQLLVFCGRMAFEPGCGALRRAVAWAVDGLNSPMETVLLMLLCLPKAYGGLEFPRPLANPSIPVPRELWVKTGRRHIVPDLFWPEANLMVEFNGKEPHEERGILDQERLELAQDMGYAVITFRKEDLYDRKRFTAKAQSVAKHLGHELPRQSAKSRELQTLLSDMLLRHERWV